MHLPQAHAVNRWLSLVFSNAGNLMNKTTLLISGALGLTVFAAFVCWTFFHSLRMPLPIAQQDSSQVSGHNDQPIVSTSPKGADPPKEEGLESVLQSESFQGVSASDESLRLRALLNDRMRAESWLPELALDALSPGNVEEVSLATNDLIRRREVLEGLRPNQVRYILETKAMALELLGVAALEDDRQTLRSAITLDGARNLASEWIDQIPKDDQQYRYLTELGVYELIQGRAGRGLAYTGVAEDAQVLEQTYREFRSRLGQFDYSKPRTDEAAYVEGVFGQLADALALRDYLKDTPRAEGLEAILITGDYHDIVLKYLGPYHVNYVPLSSQN